MQVKAPLELGLFSKIKRVPGNVLNRAAHATIATALTAGIHPVATGVAGGIAGAAKTAVSNVKRTGGHLKDIFGKGRPAKSRFKSAGKAFASIASSPARLAIGTAVGAGRGLVNGTKQIGEHLGKAFGRGDPRKMPQGRHLLTASPLKKRRMALSLGLFGHPATRKIAKVLLPAAAKSAAGAAVGIGGGILAMKGAQHLANKKKRRNALMLVR